MKSFALMALMAVNAYGVALAEDAGDAVASDDVSALVDSAMPDDLTPPSDGDIVVDGDIAAALDAADADAAEGDAPIQSDQANDVVSAIDTTMAKNSLKSKQPSLDDNPVPNNYRAPPKQNRKPKAARERPNIFDHALLKSMDLSFVKDGFARDGSRQNPSAVGMLSGGKHGQPHQPQVQYVPTYNAYGQVVYTPVAVAAPNPYQ